MDPPFSTGGGLCLAGQFWDAGDATCRRCPAGKYTTAAQVTPTAAAPNVVPTACNACPLGSYAADPEGSLGDPDGPVGATHCALATGPLVVHTHYVDAHNASLDRTITTRIDSTPVSYTHLTLPTKA